MKKDVKVKMNSIVDDIEMEFLYEGVLIDENPRILKFTEEMDNLVIDTAIIFEKNIIINRSKGVEMFQEFIEGENSIMDYTSNGVVFEFNVFTETIINKEGYLKIVYSTETGETKQQHKLEIYYS
ncbi:DUF1934 family protein [Mycoplasmatota bacterium WC44]